MGSLFGGGSDNQAKTQQAQAFAQNAAIKNATGQIKNSFAGFTPAWYDTQYQNLVGSMLPGEQKQFKQTSDQLGFKLANQGLGKSSQATKLGESLSAEDTTAKQNIANSAKGQVNQLRQGVNQSESSLIGEASLANSPGDIAAGSLQTASGFQSPLSAQPIGQLFGNWANVYLANSQNRGVNASNAGLPLTSGTSTGYGSSFMNPVGVVH